MKAAEGFYAMMVRSFGIKKAELEEKPKIVIPDSMQPLLAEFGELMSDDFRDSLLPMRDFW